MEAPDAYRKFLGTEVTVVIDRPLGSSHPTHGFRYETNYGYLPDTLAGDGEEIDAYVLGVSTPCATFTGRCIAIIYRRDDNEHKLVVAPEPLRETEIVARTAFVEQFYDTFVELAAG